MHKGKKHKQEGGLLVGPSHEEGGIGAVISGGEEVELEGGEYIINAQTTAALGEEFLDKLNSTQTTYHTGGYGPNELPNPSLYKQGGKIGRKNMRRRKFHLGGRPHSHVGPGMPPPRTPAPILGGPGGGGQQLFGEGSPTDPDCYPGSPGYPKCAQVRDPIQERRRGGRVRRLHQGGGAHIHPMQHTGIDSRRPIRPKPISPLPPGMPPPRIPDIYAQGGMTERRFPVGPGTRFGRPRPIRRGVGSIGGRSVPRNFIGAGGYSVMSSGQYCMNLGDGGQVYDCECPPHDTNCVCRSTNRECDCPAGNSCGPATMRTGGFLGHNVGPRQTGGIHAGQPGGSVDGRGWNK